MTITTRKIYIGEEDNYDLWVLAGKPKLYVDRSDKTRCYWADTSSEMNKEFGYTITREGIRWNDTGIFWTWDSQMIVVWDYDLWCLSGKPDIFIKMSGGEMWKSSWDEEKDRITPDYQPESNPKRYFKIR